MQMVQIEFIKHAEESHKDGEYRATLIASIGGLDFHPDSNRQGVGDYSLLNEAIVENVDEIFSGWEDKSCMINVFFIKNRESNGGCITEWFDINKIMACEF